MSPRSLVLVMMVLAACSGERKASAPPAAQQTAAPWEPHQLRTYAVPAGHEQDLKRLLESSSYPVSVVSQQGTQTQFVRLNPQFTGSGYFVLSAPAGIHDGVKGLIDVLGKAPAPRAASTIEVGYWLVLGWPAAQTEVSPQLAEAADALKQLGNLGPMRFEPLEKLTLAALDGEEGETTGRLATIKQVAASGNDAVKLNVEIMVRGFEGPASVQTALELKPGQFAVLARAGYTPGREARGTDLTAPAGEPTLFYLVRARVED